MDDIQEICKAVNDEKKITDDIIERMIKQEKQVYYWNIGRILCEYKLLEKDWMELARTLSKVDPELDDIDVLKDLKQFYRSHPDIYDFYKQHNIMN